MMQADHTQTGTVRMPSAAPVCVHGSSTGSSPSITHTRRKLTGWECARVIVREEGVRGLFQGLSMNLVRGLGGAMLLVGYDEIKNLMNLK